MQNKPEQKTMEDVLKKAMSVKYCSATRFYFLDDDEAPLIYKAMREWEQVTNSQREQSITALTDKVRKQEEEITNLKTVMIAAAEEIQSKWDAHCDEQGYGPTSLMHRLEKGIPSKYGYTAGAFEKSKQEIERLKGLIAKMYNEFVRALENTSPAVSEDNWRKFQKINNL